MTDYAELARDCRKHADFLDGIIGIPVTYEATFPQMAFRDAAAALDHLSEQLSISESLRSMLSYERDHLSAENARLREIAEAISEQAPIDSEWGYCGCCQKSGRHLAECAVALARAALQQGNKK